MHHIVPWEECKAHDYSNLITLCPTCHRRADKDEIDRKSLRLYKENLAKEFGQYVLKVEGGQVYVNTHQRDLDVDALVGVKELYRRRSETSGLASASEDV